MNIYIHDMIDCYQNPTDNTSQQVYEYTETIEGNSSQLAYSTTMISNGNVNGEYFMTRGHKHLNPTEEIYRGISGEGIIYEITSTGQTIMHTLKPCCAVIIQAGSAHRVINTGNNPLTFITIVRADAGHDYNVQFPIRFFTH